MFIALSIVIIFSKPKISNKNKILNPLLYLIILLISLLIISIFNNFLTKPIGIILLTLCTIYFIINIKSIKEDSKKSKVIAIDLKEISKNIFLLILSGSLILLGANLLTDSGKEIANMLNVPEFLIGLIFASIGTSLPELMTCITSIKKGVSEIGIGNMIGASILNILLVLGTSICILPIKIEDTYTILHLPFLIFTLLVFYLKTKKIKTNYSKKIGFFMIFIYILYILVTILNIL